MPNDAVERQVTTPSSGLLAGLAVHERNAIQRASQLQFCEAGDVLLHSNARSRSVFFPVDAVVAVIRRLRDDRAIAAGLFGSDGLAGIGFALEMTEQSDDVVVQSAGFVYCMTADDLAHQFHGTGRLQKSIFRFTQEFLAQVGQNAVCNRYHSLRERLAKWLLMIDDRGGSIGGPQSRRLLAIALGAKECEIGDALTALASGGVRERRHAIAIKRAALQADCCECYDLMAARPAAE